MRPLLLIPLLLAGCLRAQPGGVAGVVVDQSGKPLSGVHLRLVTGDFGSNNGVDAVYGAISDAAGRFSAEGMKPGLYLVIAERAGFIQTAAGTSPMPLATLPLKPGQRVADYRITMTARALIAGRVMDEYGDPVAGVSVQTEPVPPDRPHVNLFGSSNAATDDRGEFRLITAPGKYYLKANQEGRRVEIRTDGTSGAPFTTTYYPSAANAGASSVVQVGAGQDVAGIEIRLLRAAASAPVRGFSVSGMVTGTPDNERANVFLRYGENAGQLSGSRFTATGADGKFTFRGMPPGFYSALAIYSSGRTSLQSRAVSFELAGADETGLQLSLAPGEELAGTLELVGGAPGGAPEKCTVRLEAMGGSNPMGQTEPPAAEVGKDGSFRIANVLPGRFRPVVEPMPENGYVKEVGLDGKAAADGLLDFSQGVGGSRLKITVSRAGGRISGRVLGKDGEPAIGLVEVFFAADSNHLQEDGTARVSDGKYSFQAIRPGKYRLFAIDVLELIPAIVAGGNSEEAMKQFFDAAEEIEIKEGDSISKDISVWTKMPEKKEVHVPPR
jgi:protocatechuate 3,4-dioxygenase beta subunit